MCKILIAPVKNENSEVILFVLDFDELATYYEKKSSTDGRKIFL